MRASVRIGAPQRVGTPASTADPPAGRPRPGCCQPSRPRNVSEVMRRIAIALALALALAAPSAAQARVHTIAPPGNSGVGQYLETVPTAGGGQPTNTLHAVGGAIGGSGGSGGAGGTAVSSGNAAPSGTGASSGTGAIATSTRRALAAQGPAGAAAAALAQATAPPSSPNSARAARARAHSAVSAAATGRGSSPAASVFKSLTGATSGGGLGPLLPFLLIGSLVGAGVLAVLRRRRTS